MAVYDDSERDVGGSTFSLPALDALDDLPLPELAEGSRIESSEEPDLRDDFSELRAGVKGSVSDEESEVASEVADFDPVSEDASVDDEPEFSEPGSIYDEVVEHPDYLNLPPEDEEEAPESDDLADSEALRAMFRAQEASGGELPDSFEVTKEPTPADLFNLDQVIADAIDEGASDIHISPDDYTAFSILGAIERKPQYGMLTGFITEGLQQNILTHVLEANFVERLELDTSYVLSETHHAGRRCRLSVGKTFGDIFMVFRVISDNIPSPEDLGVSEELREWSRLPNGLIMMNGPTGTGKALALSTLLPTPDGPTELRNIEVGSRVFDSKHNVVNVTGLSPIDETPELYRVALSDGQTILADANHQWIVSSHSSRALKRDKRTLELKARKDAMLVLADAIDSSVFAAETARVQELHEFIESLGAHKAFPRIDSLQRVFRFMDTPYKRGRGRSKLYYTKEALRDLASRLRQKFEYSDDSPLRVMTTAEMIDEGIKTNWSGSNFAIPVAEDSGLDTDASLPIDPYLFGYWLGDGSSSASSIAVGYSDLQEVLPNLAKAWEGEVRVTEYEGAAKLSLVTKVKPFQTTLKELGVFGNKHIPNVYLKASRAQRLELLRGIMDSDGSASERDHAAGVGFANKALSEDTLSLVRSLGMSATLLYKNTYYRRSDGSRKQCKGAYYFNFTSSEEVFKSRRKQKAFVRAERRSLSDWIYIHSIERVMPDDSEYEAVRCISVDSEDHSYLCADRIVTHNSTTLASLLNSAIQERAQKIITIERPIEYVFGRDGKGFVTQREVGPDSREFSTALDSAMRQAPDIIMIGESRNRVEIDQVLRAAETGHLTFTTMHTNSAAATINRIKSLFEGSEQARVLSTLSDVARGFANQVLVPTVDGSSRFAIREVLPFTEEVSALVAEADVKGIRDFQIENHITMEDGLVKAVVDGRCTLEAAKSQSAYPHMFDQMIKDLG